MPPRRCSSGRSPTTRRGRWRMPGSSKRSTRRAERLAERAEVERSLREITARISAARDLPAILQLGVDEAARLMGGNGARIDLIDPALGVLRWAYASGSVRPDDSEIEADASEEELEKGLAGQAVVHGRPFWTGDYVDGHDLPARHRRRRLRRAPRHPFGHVGADVGRRRTDRRADRLQPTGATPGTRPMPGFSSTIADQAAIAVRTTRLIEELDRSREALGRRAAAERALREIAARITVLRDPSRDPRRRRRACRPARRRRRRHPRPPRSGHRQPPLGPRRRPGRPLLGRGTGAAVDLGRGRRDRDGRRRGPGHRRRRRPRRPVPAVARVDRVLRADRLPVDDRGADHRRVRAARRHRGLRDESRPRSRLPTAASSVRSPARPRSPSPTRG